MYQPDDNDIDKISREAADLYHAPGAPDWNSVQQRLDKVLPEEKEKKRGGFFFFFIILGLTLAGTGTFLYHQNGISNKPEGVQEPSSASKSTTQASPTPSVTQSSAPKAKTGQEQPDQNLAVNSRSNEQPTSQRPAHSLTNDQALNRNGSSSEEHFLPAGTSKSEDNLNSRPNSNAKSGRRQNVSQPSNKHPKGNKSAAIAGAGLATAENATPTGGTDYNVSTQNEPVSKNNPAITPKADTAPLASQSQQPTAATQPPAKTKDSTAAAAKKKPASHGNKAIFFGAVVGMDLSTVKFTYGQQPGYNFGLMAGYQFSSHWSAATGLIYTKKNYKLDGADYHPPKHNWTQYVYLETVAGYCQMWELPVLVRYNFGIKPNSSFFVSTGLSSYFMKHQAYSYDYKNNMGVPGTSSWSSDSSFNHIFSILDLSAGFEKKMGKHVSLQVEPYARVPLSGVGFGDIRLSSFGLNVNVLYHKHLR